MSIEELKKKHLDIVNCSSDDLYEDLAGACAYISISFCIDVLKSLRKDNIYSTLGDSFLIKSKIQELEKLIEK